MIKVSFITTGGCICGFVIDGHSGYAPSGEDIVCSAVSSVSHMAYVGIEAVLRLECKVSTKDGHMELFTKDYQQAQVPLKMLETELRQIEGQFPDNITISYRERRGLKCYN